MVLFLNGIPIVTMELKNQLTGQNFKHSENQYRFSRDPKEPLLQFKRVLVHFCVDNNQVSMTTNLKGGKTRFFPYNKDIENPSVQKDYRSSYLWKEVLNPNSLLDIIENFAHVSNEKEYFFNEEKETVDNFLYYVNSNAYDNSIIHRSIEDFVIQGGGYLYKNGSINSLEANPPVINEPGNSNIKWTLAMAKLPGDPNSATSEWFINLADNIFLDSQNGGFTVIGRLLNGLCCTLNIRICIE